MRALWYVFSLQILEISTCYIVWDSKPQNSVGLLYSRHVQIHLYTQHNNLKNKTWHSSIQQIPLPQIIWCKWIYILLSQGIELQHQGRHKSPSPKIKLSSVLDKSPNVEATLKKKPISYAYRLLEQAIQWVDFPVRNNHISQIGQSLLP